MSYSADYRTPSWVNRAREHFPILMQEVNKRPLAYLDNAATTQMPDAVLDRIVSHYHSDNANVHRGTHALSERSTASLEGAREAVRAFVNAPSAQSIVFTSGATGAINMVATGLRCHAKQGRSIVVSRLEHHANFVPWQQLCKATGARLQVAPLDSNLDIDMDALEGLLSGNDVLVLAVTHVSNVTGTVAPVSEITRLAHRHGALVLVDAAQSIRHESVDVQYIDCDFLCFSGHKMLGPTGTGVLYGKPEALEMLSPSLFGGEMVDVVSDEETTYEGLPLRLEAGTPNYTGAIGLAAAVSYIEETGRESVSAHEHALLRYAEAMIAEVEGAFVYGNPAMRAGCLSFGVEGLHPYDLAKLLDAQGIAIRSGSQCAQPLLRDALGTNAVARVSPAFYNTFEEINAFIIGLSRAIRMLRAAGAS